MAWIPYAPQLADGFRKTYRRLLRWNDELPFVKFAIAEDERVILAAEVPLAGLDRDALGRAIARLVAVCDLLLDESAAFIQPGSPARTPSTDVTPATPSPVLERYAADIAELVADDREAT